jgi:hypothetical protein
MNSKRRQHKKNPCRMRQIHLRASVNGAECLCQSPSRISADALLLVMDSVGHVPDISNIEVNVPDG